MVRILYEKGLLPKGGGVSLLRAIRNMINLDTKLWPEIIGWKHFHWIGPLGRCVMVLWCHGAVVSYCYGVMVLCCHGVMVSWCYGVLVLWCHSVMVSWSYGVIVLWYHGASVSDVWCCRRHLVWEDGWCGLLTKLSPVIRAGLWTQIEKGSLGQTRRYGPMANL